MPRARAFARTATWLLMSSLGAAACDDGARAPADAAFDLVASGDIAGRCSARANPAPPAMITQVAAAIPTGKGGPAIRSGTYFVTSSVVYTGVGGPSGATGLTIVGTLYVAGPSYELITQVSNMSAPSSSSGAFSVSGGNITIQQACPTATTTPFSGFDSDGTSVVNYAPGLTPPQSVTFTLQ